MQFSKINDFSATVPIKSLISKILTITQMWHTLTGIL